ncbi:uncharacterized protein LOC116199943 isoform X2 [Punica granatum]|uniref:Uncharacterized protein n=2 Tax=Punica granatum TaxID=22663 RepID=A0A2I0L465_PUNGR|nr:uncharacterized protein LOC116199943 isoform X2 [Punica granatum]PKI75474.1 hypothetical protein CRG98_004144 [Punica granatum]
MALLMSSTAAAEVVKDQELKDNSLEDNKTNVCTDVKDLKEEDIGNDGNPMPSPQQEEEIIKKKYGGLLTKKPPLISKDHERAFFDSADWALGKGAGKPKGPLEALRPKLQPTPHQQVRRSAYAPSDDHGGDGDHSDEAPEDSNFKQDEGGEKSISTEEQQSCPEKSENIQH